MCGIVGIAAKDRISDGGWLLAGRDSLHHRGPDDAGLWWSDDERVGFAHRRLAIIDLTPKGHQPMRDERGELTIVFNGEIYNYLDLREELAHKGHVFCSDSDTEVILAAYREWGRRFLERLNGMFAFALFDSRQNKVLLARDRAGEKPLFYSLSRNELRFASELKALFADRSFCRRVDRQALDCYLAMGFVPGKRCMLQGVNKLPPAHALEFDLSSGDICTWCYWHLPEIVNSSVSTLDERALLDELEELLENSVRRQLIADVPVGVLLSGGLDSSLVTAMAVRTGSKLKTFTIRFPQNKEYDETHHARLIARTFETEHLELEAPESTVDLLPLLARQFDEPIVDSSMIPTYLVSRLVREHCTVALGGDGGDELFGGYKHYSRLLWLEEIAAPIPLSVRRLASTAARLLLPIGFKGRNWLESLAVDSQGSVPLIAAYFDRETRQRLMAGHGEWDVSAEAIREERIPKSDDLLQRATRMDFGNYLPEDILVKVDRASMANSLEVRAPFLDHRLIDFAFGKVPSHLKATSRERKVLLRKLGRRILPRDFDHHRKQGFSIPIATWLQTGPWQTFFSDVLTGSTNTLYEKKTVASLLEGQRRGRANSERLFALVMLQLWAHNYQVSV